MKMFIPSLPQFPICDIGGWLEREHLNNSHKISLYFSPETVTLCENGGGELHLPLRYDFPPVRGVLGGPK